MNNRGKEHRRILKAAEEVRRLCGELCRTKSRDAAVLDNPPVPRDRGIYLWRHKGNGAPAYVGVGLGKRGLYGRIMRQHLSRGYHKSVFRLKILRDKGLPEKESVPFIRDNFTIAFLKFPDDSVIRAAEALLIAALDPKYNRP